MEDLIDEMFSEPSINFQMDTLLVSKFDQPWSSCKNFTCLVVKYYIYRQRCLHQQIAFQGFKNYLRNIEAMEKFYAVKNGKLHLHLKKYNPKLRCENSENSNINEYIAQYINAL